MPESCDKNAWTKAWHAWLQEARLPEHSRWIIERQLKHLEYLSGEIAEVEKRIEEATREDPVVQKLLEQASAW